MHDVNGLKSRSFDYLQRLARDGKRRNYRERDSSCGWNRNLRGGAGNDITLDNADDLTRS